MRVLLGCEYTQVVCLEFRKRGHEAFSCDFLPCTGGHPEFHLQGDVIEFLYTSPPKLWRNNGVF